MKNLLLHIRGLLASLFHGTTLAITYGMIDIRDLKVRYVSYSSSIELPLDNNNKQIFGFPDEVKSGSVIPFREMDAVCTIDGDEYFKGKFEILETGEAIQGNIVDSTIEIFDLIEGKKLYELDYLFDTAWNASDIDSFRSSTSSIAAPVGS